jgi:hypothetical protein
MMYVKKRIKKRGCRAEALHPLIVPRFALYGAFVLPMKLYYAKRNAPQALSLPGVYAFLV